MAGSGRKRKCKYFQWNTALTPRADTKLRVNVQRPIYPFDSKRSCRLATGSAKICGGAVRRSHAVRWHPQLVGATRATPSASPIRTGLSEFETYSEFGSR